MARMEVDAGDLGRSLGGAATEGLTGEHLVVVPAPVAAPHDVSLTTAPWRHGLRQAGLEAELLPALVAGLLAVLVASTSRSDTLAATCALAIWAVSSFHMGRAASSPLTRPFRTTLQNLMPPLACTAAGVAFLGLTPETVRVTGAAVVVAAAVSVAARLLRRRMLGPVRVVVVGDRAGLVRGIGHLWTGGARTVGAGVVEDGVTSDDLDPGLYDVPTAVGVANIAGLVAATRSDAVVVSPGPAFTSADLKRLQQRLEHLPVAVGVLGVLDGVAPHRIRPGWIGPATIVDVRNPRPSGWVRLVKSAGDRVAATAALLLAAPVLLALVVVVKATSPGPAFFVQDRVGRAGRPFRLYKLRSMVDGADAAKASLAAVIDADSPLFKLKDDPRITRVGEFMRKYSLDELPQLWNVVKGDMSLVGPRPHLPEETALMGPDALRRLAVRPGLTGLWQVSGRSDLDWETAVRLDTYYADNWSVGGDLRILAKTLPAVVRRSGAY